MKFFQNWRVRKPETDSESVYIREKSGVRSLHIGSDTVQSAMRIARPNDLEVVYTRGMMAWLLFNREPQAVLMIGLGGGSLAKFVYHRLSEACVVAVEVNPKVVQIARQYFQVPADDERLRVVVDDGADYVAKLKLPVDIIMVDGYEAEAQAAALSTQTFYRDCFRALTTGGILVVNLWGGDYEFTACVERIGAAFDGRVICLPAGKPGNVVVLAFRASPGQPLWRDLRHHAQDLKTDFGLEFPHFVADLALMNRHDSDRLLI